MKLKTRYTLIMILIVVAVVLSVVGSSWRPVQETMHRMSLASADSMVPMLHEQMQKRGEILTRFLAENLIDPLYQLDLEAIYPLLLAASEQKDVMFAHVYDLEGMFVHDGLEEMPSFGMKMPSITPEILQAEGLFSVAHTEQMDFFMPIRIGEKRLGGVHVSFSLKRINAQIFQMRQQLDTIKKQGEEHAISTLGLILLLLLALGGMVAFWVASGLSRPIDLLTQKAELLGQGDLESDIVLDRKDELGVLASTLDGMRCNLKNSLNEIRQQNEELKELDQLKDDFLANTTHELKTPLNGILGLGNALLDGAYGSLPTVFQKPIGQIISSANRLLTMAIQVLDISPGRQTEVQKESVALFMHLDQFLVPFKSMTDTKGVALQVSVADTLKISTDPKHLDTILMNLVGNAVKFTHQGYVRISAQVLEGGVLALSVKDTGIGIPEAYHQKIFERFQQGFASENRSYEGTGLGLAIMKQSLELLGGVIHLESLEGSGSTFTALLPLREEHRLEADALLNVWQQRPDQIQPDPITLTDGPPKQTRRVSDIQPDTVQPDTTQEVEFEPPPVQPGTDLAPAIQEIDDALQAVVLVVDDDAINREVLRANLNRNFRVVEVENGTLCLQQIEQETFDLVLLDLMMPGLSGYDVLAALQKSSSEKSSPPVIVLSAKNQTSAITRAFQMGAVDYVTKPFNREELMARIRAHVTLRRNANELVERKLAEKTLLQKKVDLEQYNQFIRKTFGRYMSDDVVESILDTPEGLQLGGEKKLVTVVMTDLRGFTAIGERLPSEQVISMLNMYLDVMTEIILTYNGTIIEFLGDGILALFGTPITRDDDAERACACVLQMQLAMPGINARNRQHGFPEVLMGAGINTGTVVAGNIGSEKRSKYGVVGNTINLTARLESFTVGGQILVSESTLKACGNLLRIDDEFQVKPKGVSESITVYQIGGINGDHQVHLPPPEKIHLKPLSPAPTVVLTVLEDKQSVRGGHKGKLTHLAKSTMEITTSLTLRRLTNLQIEILDRKGHSITSQLYGKVVSVDGENKRLRIELTAISPEVEELFAQWLDGVLEPLST